MALKSIRDKISNVAGGEVLGDARAEETKKSPQPAPIRRKSLKEDSGNKVERVKNKSEKRKVEKTREENQTNNKFNLFKRKKEVEIEEETSQQTSPQVDRENKDNKIKNLGIKDVMEGYEDVLSILGIKEEIQVDVEFTSDQLDYVEFTQTQPLGFDFDEVADFISRTKYSMHKLESALKQREKDVVRIASEVKRVEQKMIEQNQQKELDRMIGGMTEEERLIEENMELKVQISELTRKLRDNSGNDKVAELTKQIEVLQAENNMLKLNNTTKGKDTLANKLPSFEEIEEDEEELFNNMLDDIGGLYDDE